MTLTSTSAALLCWRALELETILRRRQLAFHHVELLSQTAFSGEPTPTHGFSRSAGRDAPALKFCGGRVRGNAGACASADRRAGKGNTVDSDASPKTALCKFCAAGAPTLAFTSAALGAGGSTHLAGGFYDFNVWSQRKRGEKLRYMHENPVKRGLVLEPGQWDWSSFRDYAYDEPGRVKLNQWPAAKLKRIA